MADFAPGDKISFVQYRTTKGEPRWRNGVLLYPPDENGRYPVTTERLPQLVWWVPVEDIASYGKEMEYGPPPKGKGKSVKKEVH